jgi:tellurite resistance protein
MLVEQVEILRAACCIAGVDGVLTDREEAVLRKLKDHVGVGEASFTAMIEAGKNDPKFYQRLFNMLATEADRTLKTLFAVAASDGDVGEGELEVLRYFADKLGMEPERFEQLLNLANVHAGNIPEDA